ncbi:MAG: helix-turn-helix domain-containing protein [Solirubrobacteraceae bacterium]
MWRPQPKACACWSFWPTRSTPSSPRSARSEPRNAPHDSHRHPTLRGAFHSRQPNSLAVLACSRSLRVEAHKTTLTVCLTCGQYRHAHRTTKSARPSQARAEVAAQLGVSRTWLYDAAKAGRIPSIRIGGAHGPLRFVPQDLQRWIDDARAEWAPGRSARPTPPASLDLSNIIGQPAARVRSRRRR